MTSVVFIHGTGVREPRLSSLFAQVTAGLTAAAPNTHMVAYRWGEQYGARLAADGASIPYGPGAGTDRDAHGLGERVDETDAWARLYEDPVGELTLAAAGATTETTPPGAAFPGERQRALLLELAAYGDERADRLGPGLAEAATQLSRSQVLASAAKALDAETLAWVLARALTAALIAASVNADETVQGDADARDAVVAALAVRLGGPPAGTSRGLVRRMVQKPLVGLGSRYAVRRRRALTDAAHPIAGDILKYLARGEDVRQQLRDLIASVTPPVVLLGHSLGGVIALDTLISGPHPGVELLVTVGSQGPFLYETGALPSLAHPTPLPDHVPSWLNLYDRRDLLGYAAEPLFPGRAQDVVTNSRQPFPVAHSAYWTDSMVYRTIGEQLP